MRNFHTHAVIDGVNVLSSAECARRDAERLRVNAGHRLHTHRHADEDDRTELVRSLIDGDTPFSEQDLDALTVMSMDALKDLSARYLPDGDEDEDAVTILSRAEPVPDYEPRGALDAIIAAQPKETQLRLNARRREEALRAQRGAELMARGGLRGGGFPHTHAERVSDKVAEAMLSPGLLASIPPRR